MIRPIFISLLAVAATFGPNGRIDANSADAGLDLQAMDQSITPGDDFDKYANGTWEDRAQIPPDRSELSVFSQLADRANRRVKALINEAARQHGADRSYKRIADYYSAFADQREIDRRGLAPIADDIARLEAISDRNQLSAELGATLRADVDPINITDFHTENLFGLFVTQSFNDPSKSVPYLLQGGLGLPDRDYYLSDSPQMREIRSGYLGNVGEVLRSIGLNDSAGRARKIIRLEEKIAAAHESLVDSTDSIHANNPWYGSEFATKAPGIDWASYFDAAGLRRGQEFIVWQPAAVQQLSALVASEPLGVWKDWLVFHRVNQMTDVLPSKFDVAHFHFYGATLQGASSPRPRSQRAVDAVNAALGAAVGRLYVQKYFPASAKRQIDQMASLIKFAVIQRLRNIDWMSPATKAEAVRKVQRMAVGLGYPEHWNDRKFEVRGDDAFGNLDRYRLAEYKYQLSKLARPADPGEWWLNAQTVNAANLPAQNALIFPAAILDKGFFDPAADAATNFGGIGAIIGHEVTHSFDELGATFDSAGVLRDWWTPADAVRYKQATAGLAKQYSGYEVLPGVRLNGNQLLSENIADLAGLAAAYDAYQMSLKGRDAPVIQGLTGDQRFFLAYAQAHRSKIREALLRSRVATDLHAPGRWRVQTVRNFDPWYRAFFVRPKDRLYLAPSRRVRLF